MVPRRPSLWRTVRAAGIFIVVAGVWFWSLTNTFSLEHLWDPFTRFVAATCAGIFRLLGADVLMLGDTLNVNGTSLTIFFGCNGLEAHGLYLAAILASAMSWRRKLTGLIVGSVAVFAVNLARVCLLFVAAGFDEEVFHYIHTVVAPLVVILFTMAFFLWWDSRDVRKTKAAVAMALD